MVGILSAGRLLSRRAGGSTAFTPASLFAANEQGVWYDPSDLTTLYQDAAGTTPVTGLEQPVGLILDKSGRGNHASQSTAASRPVLSARYNLLTHTEQFDNAAWVKESCTISQNATTSPDGTATADKIVSASATTSTRVSQSVTGLLAAEHTSTVYAQKGEARFLQILWTTARSSDYANFDLDVGTVTASVGQASITSVGNGWYRLSLRSTLTAGTGSLFIQIIGAGNAARNASYAGNGVDGVFLWGADLRVSNDGVGIPSYQRVGAATDYDTTGFPSYLRFDGTDDSAATGSIDFSGTDKMSVVAGVRKLSDAARGILVELSATRSTNNGAFTLDAPGASFDTDKYVVASKGTVDAFAPATATGLTAPVTNVLTATLDIAGDVARLRANGAQVAEVLTDQGTGNFGNYPLYIGSRGGSSLRFNGRLYGLLVIGRALTTTEITNTETWMNQRTRAF